MGNLLLVIVLGLLLVGGAATATGADDACGAGHLALASASRRVAESCAGAGTPTASCCESVVATVPCVCRVAVQHPVDHSLFLGRLNASRIVALYSSCRGRLRLRGAGYLATAACLGVLEHRSFVTSVATTVHSPLMLSDANQQPKARGREHVEPSSCDSTPMAAQLVQHCNIGNIRPSRRCCTVVLAIIDDQDTDCLCMVVDEAEFTKSYLSVSAVWGYYRACGGRQQRPPKDTDACEHAPAPAPPPPPPSPPRPPSRSPPAPPKRPSKAASAVTAFLLGVAVVAGIAFLLSLAVLLAVKVKKSREVPAAIPVPVVGEQWVSMPHWPQVPAPVPAQAPAPVDAEAGQVQQQAVAQPPPPPLFAPRAVVKKGEAPPAPPPLIPFPPPLPLKVPTGESVSVGAV
ncbi:unnamed protein product [Miscanthus lutarioriparius]|uniref:Bifunctional inhibitor/plant lipid transfer protein/seed storage helical domain-containing protein n=1 Tax=Miscanthus lutarioriparius TaxID=422564 RepID=A0A811SQ69_9POAL|nr:unnamed protein product [Miscanthus lutarioriparius]